MCLEPVGDGEGEISNEIRAAVDAKLDECYQLFVKGSVRLREGSSMSQRLRSTELPREGQARNLMSGEEMAMETGNVGSS